MKCGDGLIIPGFEQCDDALDGRWDVSDVQGKVIKDYADEFGVDLSKIQEQAGKKK